MKYEVSKNEAGEIRLKLGLNHDVTFAKGVDIEEIVAGVEQLIEAVVGISAFELTMAVVKEANKTYG